MKAPGYDCPHAKVCETCPCASEDDACFPGERLRADRDAYKAALADLLEEAQDMRSYVPEYFAKKWKHDEALDRARAVLADQPTEATHES